MVSMYVTNTSSSGDESSEDGCFGVCSSNSHASHGKRRAPQPPLQANSDDFVDAALVSELNKLSVQERERLLDDIHGIAKDQIPEEETLEFLRTRLAELDVEIAKLPAGKRADLDTALNSLDDSFKLMFLRADEYKPRLAANRLALHFSTKRQLFGADKLAQEISIEDLQKEDVDFIQTGKSYLGSPYHDQSGRPIWFDGSTREAIHNADVTCRANWYRFMTVLRESETAQKRGIVALVYSINDEYATAAVATQKNSPSMDILVKNFIKVQSLVGSLPVRITSLHYCYNNPWTHFFLKTVQTFQPTDHRFRVRTHFGSCTELKYSLLTFGIPTDGIILLPGETDLKPALAREYVEQRRRREVVTIDAKQQQQQHPKPDAAESTPVEPPTTTIFPARNDVLIRRGRPTQTRRKDLFDSIIQIQSVRYSECKHSFEKARIVDNIVQQIHDAGGRFLIRQKNKQWIVADDETAKTRIRYVLRLAPSSPKPS